MLKHLTHLKVFKIETVSFSITVLANLHMRRKSKLSHERSLPVSIPQRARGGMATAHTTKNPFSKVEGGEPVFSPL
jgi:hypothetical protein